MIDLSPLDPDRSERHARIRDRVLEQLPHAPRPQRQVDRTLARTLVLGATAAAAAAALVVLLPREPVQRRPDLAADLLTGRLPAPEQLLLYRNTLERP